MWIQTTISCMFSRASALAVRPRGFHQRLTSHGTCQRLTVTSCHVNCTTVKIEPTNRSKKGPKTGVDFVKQLFNSLLPRSEFLISSPSGDDRLTTASLPCKQLAN